MANRIIYGESARLTAWAAECIGLGSFRDDAQAIGIEKNGRLSGVVVYDTFSPTDCYMHAASDGSGHWLTREFLSHVFAYPFITCGYRRVTAPVAESNTKSLRLNLHLGFKVEGRHPYAATDGGAMMTMALMRSDCKYLPDSARHMRKQQHG